MKNKHYHERQPKFYNGYYSVSRDYKLLFDLILQGNEIICWCIDEEIGSGYAVFKKERISNVLDHNNIKYDVIIVYRLKLIFDLRKDDVFESFESFCKHRCVEFILNKKQN